MRELKHNQRRKSSAPSSGVNDSEPEAEFQESVNKSKAMLKAVALAETFARET
jgi:anthranilate/para-aminobenzoate synthase component I